MALDITTRQLDRTYDHTVIGPISQPYGNPCRVLFLKNNDQVNDAVVTIETSSDGGDTDYWIAIPFLVCGEVTPQLSYTIVPGGHIVIMFEPLERFFRISCNPDNNGGLYSTLVEFAEREYDPEED